MNLDTKMVVRRNKRKSVKLTWRFFIRLLFGLVSLNKAKRNTNKVVQIDF